MSRELSRMIHGLLRPLSDACPEACWQPAADIYRSGDGWMIKFDLAGVRPEDVELERCGRTLTIRGERRDRVIREGQRSYSMEISYNRFERSLTLPCELEAMRITTEYREGMLLVHLETPREER